jgi:hypothetical protein
MGNDEFERQKNDGRRFYIDSVPDDEPGHYAAMYRVVDRTTGQEVGRDGGEPEDQLLCRDWRWVVDALNAVAKEADALRAKVAELERVYAKRAADTIQLKARIAEFEREAEERAEAAERERDEARRAAIRVAKDDRGRTTKDLWSDVAVKAEARVRELEAALAECGVALEVLNGSDQQKRIEEIGPELRAQLWHALTRIRAALSSRQDAAPDWPAIIRSQQYAPGTHTGTRQEWFRQSILARGEGRPVPEFREGVEACPGDDIAGIPHNAKCRPAKPVCERCNDTHWMTLRDQQVACTGCPIPCRKCAREGGWGAFCERTPCGCRCHAKPDAPEAKCEHVWTGPRHATYCNRCGELWRAAKKEGA